MTPDQTIERERRWALPVAGAIALVIALQIAGAVVLQSASLPSGSRLAPYLQAVDSNGSTLMTASVLRGLGFVLVTVPLVYLFKAVVARDSTVRAGFIGVIVAGPLFLAAASVLQQIAINDVASEFVSRLPVAHPEVLATDLQRSSTLVKFSLGLTLAGTLGFLFGTVYTSQRAMRAGLLTRFWGTLGMLAGMVLGLATLLPTFAPVGVLLLVAWLINLLLVVLDKAPRGRPPAWDKGEAIPWLVPERGARRGGGVLGGAPPGSRGAEDDAIDTSGTEVEPSQPQESAPAASPPRQRGERRKRKRRQ